MWPCSWHEWVCERLLDSFRDVFLLLYYRNYRYHRCYRYYIYYRVCAYYRKSFMRAASVCVAVCMKLCVGALFVADGLDRIHVGCLARWYVAEDDANECAHGK